MAMLWLNIALVVYALLMLGGGIGGYVSAQSVPSLVTGIVSFLLLAVGLFMTKTNPRTGYLICTATTVVLILVFIERYIKTQKVMPSLGLVGLSGLMLILLLVGHFGNRRS